MEWLRDASFWLVMLVTFFPGCAAKRSSRLLLSSIPEVCQSAKVNLEAGQIAWIVSPGNKVPGVTDGTQGICKWTIKVPAGYGIEMEVVKFRLRNSRHCQVTNVQVIPRLSVPRQVNRPLTRFCGRGPRSKIWRTTYSEIDLEYAGLRDQNPHLGQIQGNSSTENPHLQQEIRPETHSRSHGRSRLSTAEKLEKIKALQRYYQKKRQEQERDDPQGYQQRLAQTKQFHGFKGRDSGSDNRRFYRHSNHTGNSVHDGDDSAMIMIDDEHFLYDNDSQVYGSFSVHPKSTYLRLFSAGEPAWISGNELNGSETKYEEYLNVLEELSKASRKLGRSRKKVKQFNKKVKKKKSQPEIFESEHLVGDSTERVTRSAKSKRRTTRRRGKTRSYRTRYYTVSLGRPRTSRKQYRVSIAKHDEPSPTKYAHPQDAQGPSETHYFQTREHNEIIPEKPTKLSFAGESKEMFTPKMSHHNPSSSSSSVSKEPEDLPGSKGTKKESFVIKVSAFQSSCGGSITAEKGRFASPGYPKKMGGKRSCLWNFQTSGETSWKLECIHFRIRKSPRCRRDHMAIRINDAEWTRYCGREGPSLTLTSSHSSKVDVALNTFRNSSARVICSWETVSLEGFRHSSYQRYWSYNLTRIPATTPSTTTTTTTTTTPSTRLIAKPSWSCPDYVHLNKEHTMCKPTPATCAIYKQGLTVTDQQQILKSHNTYRAKVARGEESGGLPGPQYSASDMQQLSWNGELAQVAQAWASACPDYHDCHECRKLLSRSYYVGQNIFYEWSSSNPGPVWETAVRLWYEEVKYVPNYLVKDFRVMNHAVIGHYTQLVWADTKEIGCGAAYHDCTKVFRGRSWKLKCKIYVCNYGPTGNYVRKPMYTIGPPASACPEGSAPSMEYPGLCTSQ